MVVFAGQPLAPLGSYQGQHSLEAQRIQGEESKPMEQTPPSMPRYLTSSNTGSYRVQDSEDGEGLAEKDGGSS